MAVFFYIRYKARARVEVCDTGVRVGSALVIEISAGRARRYKRFLGTLVYLKRARL